MNDNTASVQMLEAIDWHSYEPAEHTASEFVASLRTLLSAVDPDEVRSAYWRIENSAYPGGAIRPVCQPLVAVLAEALRHAEISQPTTVAVLDAMFLILNSDTSPEVRRACAATIADIRNTLERLAEQPVVGAAAGDVLDLIAQDP